MDISEQVKKLPCAMGSLEGEVLEEDIKLPGLALIDIITNPPRYQSLPEGDLLSLIVGADSVGEDGMAKRGTAALMKKLHGASPIDIAERLNLPVPGVTDDIAADHGWLVL